MTDEERDARLDGLLSGGKLSGPARERILSGALRGATPARRRGAWLAPLASAVAALGVLFAVTRPMPFRARGGGGATLELSCRDGRLDACRAGGLLLIHVGGAAHGGYLAAWSEPAGGGERTWYFPTADGTPLEVAANAALQTLPAGLRVPASGVTRFHLRLCPGPIARQDAATAQGCDAADADVTAVEAP